MPRRYLVSALTLLPVIAMAAPPSDKVVERYKQMLRSNPAEGTPLDRLWQAHAESGRTGALLAEFSADQTYAAQMIHGLLLEKAGRWDQAAPAFQKALALDKTNPAPALALARLAALGSRFDEAAKWTQAAVDRTSSDAPNRSENLMKLGSAYLAAGDLEKGAAAWEQTVALSPKDLSLRRQLAETYLRNHLGPRALPHLHLIEQQGSPQERAQALQEIAAIHQSKGAVDEAIHALEKAMSQTAPGNWMRQELLGQLVRLHQRYHRTPELEARWVKHANENPRDIGAYLQLIEFYERTGDHPQELNWLEKLIALAPRTTDYKLRRARLLARMDELDRAAAAFDELLGTESRQVELVFERARLDIQRDQPKAAGDRIGQLLARSGQDESVRAKALEFYQTHRLHDLAEQHLLNEARGDSREGILALANFYFSRDRAKDAQQVLSRLVKANATPDEKAAGWFQVAGVLREQNEVSDAMAAVRKALDLKEDVREFHFVLGELEAAGGRYVAAETAFERALALSQTPEATLEADQRLYDSLRNQREAGEDEARTTLPRPDAAAVATSRAAQAYLLKILRKAVDEPSEAKWLRVARWQQWSRNTRGAVDAAERALAANPGSTAAHDFLARLYAADPQGPGAQRHLRELMKLDPTNRPAYLRRLAQVEMQTGRAEDALKLFQQLVQENPGDVDTLNDLALAQQRIEQWTEALATLQRVHSLSAAPKKREAVAALLRVYDRLSLRQPAAALLLSQVDLEATTAERLSTFGDLLTFCTRHGLLDWLHQEFEGRHRVRVDDYFTEVAYGRVLKAQGRKAAAFEVLADAAFVSPDPAESLPEMVREAEELRRNDMAIQLQSQLVRLVPPTSPDSLQRLAKLQENALQPADAAQTWAKVVTRFPRDVVALEQAVDFERIWGSPERAMLLLRRMISVEPGNLRTLTAMAELALAEGNTVEAEKALEAILANTDAESADEPVKYPAVRPDDPSRLELSYRSAVQRRRGRLNEEALKGLRAFWLEKADQSRVSQQRQARLQAIQHLATLVRDKRDPRVSARWNERWTKPGGSTTEKLWALYFSGASGPLLDAVQQLSSTQPGDAGPVNAFIWLALQTGEFDRLAAWFRDRSRTASERDYLMVALIQYLDENPKSLPEGLTEKLFPDEFRVRLWQASGELAQRGFYAEAIRLRTRVFERLKSQRAVCGFDLAQWHLQLGQVDEARQVLHASLGSAGDHFASPVYSVMRALYLLTPEVERPALAKEILGQLNDQTPVIHGILTRTLIAALSGDGAEARKQLHLLWHHRAISVTTSDERATAATRHWDFVLSIGNTLCYWQFDRLAVTFWSEALSDKACVSLQAQLLPPEGEAIRARVLEVRTRLSALKLMRSAAFEIDGILQDYSRAMPPDGLLPLAEMLESYGANPVAVEVYRRVWEREPANPHALRNALSACRNAGDWDSMEAILDRVVTSGQFRQNDAAHRDLVAQYADVLEHRHDFARARELVAKLAETTPHDARIALKLGSLYERNKELAAAEQVYRKFLAVEPANTTVRIALAALLDAQGQTVAAIDILERTAGADIDTHLAELNLKAGRLYESLASLEKVTGTEQANSALKLAGILEKQGNPARAELLLRSALGRIRTMRGGFAVQEERLALMEPNRPRSEIQREFRRLRQFAEPEFAGLTEYLEAAARHAPRLGWEKEFAEELAQLWDKGEGDPSAGTSLLQDQLRRGDRASAAATWRLLSTHPALSGPMSRAASEAFEKAGEHDLALAAASRGGRLSAMDFRTLLPWVKTLQASNQAAGARKIADELAARSIFTVELVPLAAEAYAGIGDQARARSFYHRATDMDPTARQTDIHVEFAQLFLEMGEAGAARQVLRNASRNPAGEVAPGILRYLQLTGGFEKGDDLADFPLSPIRRREVDRGIFQAHLDAGRLELAMNFAQAHAEVLAEGGHRAFRAAVANFKAFPAAVTWLERRVTQQPQDRPEFAELLADWAEAELVSLQVDSAVAHLQKAHDLRPGSWRIAERLAGLRLQRREPKLAAKTVNAFLGVATEPTEKEKARQLLARIPSA